MNKCYKIIQLRRHNFRDTLGFHFFPKKLIVVPKSSGQKLKEYHFDNQEAVEKKYASIEKTKLRIGYQIVNSIENPKYYNLWREKMHNLWEFCKDNPKIKMREPKLDSEGESISVHTAFSKEEFLEEYPNTSDELLDFVTPLRMHAIQIEINGRRHYDYRLSIELFVRFQVIWTSFDEPVDKLSSALGQSVIRYIENDAGFSTADKPNRIKLCSKGLFSLIDMQTEKIYAVNYWHPFYSTAVSADVITPYESLDEFYNHIWDKLLEDVTCSE